MSDLAYRSVLVESFEPAETSGKHGAVHVRPLAGQMYPTTLYVSCSSRMKDIRKYKLGTIFKVSAALTDKEGAGDYLYVDHRDPEVVIRPKDVASFLAGLRRGDR